MRRTRDEQQQLSPNQAALIVTYGNTTRKTRPLEGDLLVIGRAANCDLGLVSPEVAPVHCLIARVPQGYRIRDCSGGRVGTRLNGKAIQEESLHDGDDLQIGTFSFKVHLPDTSFEHLAAVPNGVPVAAVAPSAMLAAEAHQFERAQRSRRKLAQLALGLRRRLWAERTAAEQARTQFEQRQGELNLQADRLRQLQRGHDQAVRKAQELETQLRLRQEDIDRHADQLSQARAEFEAEFSRRQEEMEAAFRAREAEWLARTTQAEARLLKDVPDPDGLRARAEELDRRAEELEQRAHDLQVGHERLARRDAQLDAAQKQLEEREKWLAEQSEQLAQHGDAMVAERQQVAAERKEAEELKQQIEEARQDLAARRDAWDQEQEALASRATGHEARLGEVEARAREHHTALAAVVQQLKQLAEAYPLVAPDDGHVRDAAAALQAENEALKQRLAAAEEMEAELNLLRQQAAGEPVVTENQIIRVTELEGKLAERDAQIKHLKHEIALRKAGGEVEYTGSYERELHRFRMELERDRRQLNEELTQAQVMRSEMEQAAREAELQMSRERVQLAREKADLTRLREEIQILRQRDEREGTVRERLGKLDNLKEELQEKR